MSHGKKSLTDQDAIKLQILNQKIFSHRFTDIKKIRNQWSLSEINNWLPLFYKVNLQGKTCGEFSKKRLGLSLVFEKDGKAKLSGTKSNLFNRRDFKRFYKQNILQAISSSPKFESISRNTSLSPLKGYKDLPIPTKYVKDHWNIRNVKKADKVTEEFGKPGKATILTLAKYRNQQQQQKAKHVLKTTQNPSPSLVENPKQNRFFAFASYKSQEAIRMYFPITHTISPTLNLIKVFALKSNLFYTSFLSQKDLHLPLLPFFCIKMETIKKIPAGFCVVHHLVICVLSKWRLYPLTRKTRKTRKYQFLIIIN